MNAVSNYSSDVEVAASMWDEIKSAYSHRKRFYHNLDHLEHLLEILTPFKDQFRNWNAVIFAIAYHDVVYNVLKPDNEERSARLATKRLGEISFPSEMIEFCNELILATKNHLEADREINLFTDADLSILGADKRSYAEYAENIREEYSVFPALVYNHGRKKVLMHFLQMSRTFKTKEFYDRYEEQARNNLEMELLSLK